MGFYNRFIRNGPSQEERSITSDWAAGILDPTLNTAGVTVTPYVALNYVAVFACVRLISESIASLPIDVFRNTKSQRTEVGAPKWITRPNIEMTKFEFLERVLGSLCLWGNSYNLVTRDNFGNVIEIWPVDPARVGVVRDNYTYNLTYVIGGQNLTREDVLHIKAFPSPSQAIGLSPISAGRAAISAGMATDAYAGAFWGNGAHPAGLLTVNNPNPDDDYMQRLEAGWNKNHGGAKNANKTAVLQGDIKYQALSLPAEDSQFLQTRKFQTEEIARLFRVPPHMIGDLDRATFSNIEHQSIDFVVHTLRPWMVRVEDALSGLLPNGQYTKFNESALLRGDSQSQAEAFKVAWEHGVINSNTWREKLDLPPVKDGDAYYAPLNMAPVGQDKTATVKDLALAVAALVGSGMAIDEALAAVGLKDTPPAL